LDIELCVKINSNRKSRAHQSISIQHTNDTPTVCLVRRQNVLYTYTNVCKIVTTSTRVFRSFSCKKVRKMSGRGRDKRMTIPGAHRKPFIVFNFTVEELTRKQKNTHLYIRSIHMFKRVSLSYNIRKTDF